MTNGFFLPQESGQTPTPLFSRTSSASSHQPISIISGTPSRATPSLSIKSSAGIGQNAPFKQSQASGLSLNRTASALIQPPSSVPSMDHIQKAFDNTSTKLKVAPSNTPKGLVVPTGIQNMFSPATTNRSMNQLVGGNSNNTGGIGGMDLQAILAAGLGSGNEAQFAGTLVQIANFMQRKSQERDADMESLSQELDAAKALIVRQVSTMELLGNNGFLLMELFQASKRRAETNQIRLDCLKKSMAMLQLVVKDQASIIEDADQAYKITLDTLAQAHKENEEMTSEKERLLKQVELAEEKVRASLSALEQQATAHTQHIQSMTGQMDQYIEERQQLKEHLELSKQTFREMDNKYKYELEESQQALADEKVKSAMLIEQKQVDLVQLEGRLYSSQQELVNLSRTARDTVELVEQKNTKITELEASLSDAHKKCEEWERLAAADQAQIKELTSDLAELQDVSSNTNKLLEEFQKSLEEARYEQTKLIAELQNVSDLAERKTQLLAGQIVTVQNELNDARSIASKTTEDYEQKIRKRDLQIQEYITEISNSKSLLQDVKERLNEVTKARQEMEAQYKKQIHLLEDELAGSKRTSEQQCLSWKQEKLKLEAILDAERQQLAKFKTETSAEQQRLLQGTQRKETALQEELQRLSFVRSQSADQHVKVLRDLEEKLKAYQLSLEQETQKSSEMQNHHVKVVDELKAKLKAFHIALTDEEQKYTHLQDERSKELHQMEQKLNLCQAVLHEEQQQNAQLKLERNEFSQQLEDRSRQIANSNSQLAALKVELSVYAEQISQYDSQVKFLKVQLADDAINSSERDSQVASLKLQIVELEDNLRKNAENISELKSRNQVLDTERERVIAESKASMDELQTKLAHLQGKDTEATNSISQLQERINSIEGERNRVDADIARIKADMEADYKQKYEQAISYRTAQHSAEIAKVNAKLEMLNREKASFLKEKEEMSKQLESLRQDLEQHKTLMAQANANKTTEIAALEHQLQQVVKDREQVSQQNSELNDRISQLTTQIASASLELDRVKSNTTYYKALGDAGASRTLQRGLVSELDHGTRRPEDALRLQDIEKASSDDEFSDNEMVDDLIENLSQSIPVHDPRSLKRHDSSRKHLLPGPPIFNNSQGDTTATANLKRRRDENLPKGGASSADQPHDSEDEQVVNQQRIKIRAIDHGKSSNGGRNSINSGGNRKPKTRSKIPTAQPSSYNKNSDSRGNALRTSPAVRKKTRSQSFAQESRGAAELSHVSTSKQVKKPASRGGKVDNAPQVKPANAKKHDGTKENTEDDDMDNIGALLNKTHQIAKSMNSYNRGRGKTNARVNVVSVTSNSLDMTTATFRGQDNNDGGEVDLFGRW